MEDIDNSDHEDTVRCTRYCKKIQILHIAEGLAVGAQDTITS